MTSPATVDALIDAAEQQFADQGFQGASLRAVMRAAGADPGAVHYHFGGREQLAGEVLDRILAPLNARRLELLAQVRAAGPAGPLAVDELVRAIVRPDLEAATALAGRGRGRARLIGAVYIHPATFVTQRVEAHFRPVAEAFMPDLARALPDVAPDVVSWRVRWCVFAMLGALLSDEAELFSVGLDQLTDRLVVTGAAALAAPTQPDRKPNP